MSVSVLTAKDLRASSLRNSVDVAAGVPGLQFDKQGIGAAHSSEVWARLAEQ
jgi:outer membrane receptor for ferrienterochelin and colicin